jgi:hypothetical protein
MTARFDDWVTTKVDAFGVAIVAEPAATVAPAGLARAPDGTATPKATAPRTKAARANQRERLETTMRKLFAFNTRNRGSQGPWCGVRDKDLGSPLRKSGVKYPVEGTGIRAYAYPTGPPSSLGKRG